LRRFEKKVEGDEGKGRGGRRGLRRGSDAEGDKVGAWKGVVG
jgi:hypothetical protein